MLILRNRASRRAARGGGACGSSIAEADDERGCPRDGVREAIGSFPRQPEKKFAAGLMLAYQSGEMFFEEIELSLANQ